MTRDVERVMIAWKETFTSEIRDALGEVWMLQVRSYMKAGFTRDEAFTLAIKHPLELI